MKKLAIAVLVMATAACGQADQDKMADGLDRAKAAGQDLTSRANSTLTDFLARMPRDNNATAASLAATGETRIGEVPPATEVAANAASASPQESPADASQVAPDVVAKVTELREAVLLTIPAGDWTLENTSGATQYAVTIDNNGLLTFSDGGIAQMRVPEIGSSEICFEQGGLYCYTKDADSTPDRLSFSSAMPEHNYKLIFSK